MLAREVPFGLLGNLGRSFSDLARQPKQQMVLRALLRGELVDMNHEREMKEQAVTLLRRGLLLLDDDGSFRFPSPLHEWHYRKQVSCVVRFLHFWGPLLGRLLETACVVCSSTPQGWHLSTARRLASVLSLETASRG